MDPDANLAEQLQIAKAIADTCDNGNGDGTLSMQQQEKVSEQANRLAELVTALNGWIASGGFLPKRWVLAGM